MLPSRRKNASMTDRYRQVAMLLVAEYREGSLPSDLFDYWMNRLEQAQTIREIDAVEEEYYRGARYVRNPALQVGDAVCEGSRYGEVIALRQKGMVDVQFAGARAVERRPAVNLRPNPAARRKTRRRSAPRAPAARTAPAPQERAGQVLDVTRAQFTAVVQGVYESLVKKRLGKKNFKWRGERIDEKALASGELDRSDIDELVGRAFAIATKQGQKHGHLRPGTQRATAAGTRLSMERMRDREHAEENLKDYERTMELRRKTKKNSAAAALVAIEAEIGRAHV